MNVLEHYIKEIKSVEPYLAEWTRKFPDEFIQAQVIADCYGQISEYDIIRTVAEWEQIKEQGYWMA